MTNEEFLGRNLSIITADLAACDAQLEKALADVSELRQVRVLAAARARKRVRVPRKAKTPAPQAAVTDGPF